MSDEQTANNATSRRAFIQRTGLAAFATATAATAILSSPNEALACTPIPPWLRPEIYQKLLDSFKPVEEQVKNYIFKLGGPNAQTLGLFAFRYFVDDWCGTYPKRPPIGPGPRFTGYERNLPNFGTIQEALFKWGDGSVRLGAPTIIAITILRDDIQAGLLLPAVQEATAVQVDPQFRLWKPWWPC